MAAASAWRRRYLAGLLSFESCRLPPVITAEPALALAAGDERPLFGSYGNQNFVFCGLIRREFHSARPVGFRATDVASVEYAFDDYYEDEKDKEDFKSGEEGLEIDKLGISKNIVSQLGKRGITKLFPVQVSSVLIQNFILFYFLQANAFCTCRGYLFLNMCFVIT